MGTIQCGGCGKETNVEAAFCASCGARISDPVPMWAVMLIVVAAIVPYFVYFSFFQK